MNIKPPVFVDDILNILGNIGDMSDAHRKAVLFALRKRINFGVLKCIMMIINGKKKDICPVLEIDGHILVKENKAKYVGDYFNQNGTNLHKELPMPIRIIKIDINDIRNITLITN